MSSIRSLISAKKPPIVGVSQLQEDVVCCPKQLGNDTTFRNFPQFFSALVRLPFAQMKCPPSLGRL